MCLSHSWLCSAVLRVLEEENRVVDLTTQFFLNCCYAVSREKADDEQPTECKDLDLQKSFEEVKQLVGSDRIWPHREAIGPALADEATRWLTSIKVCSDSWLSVGPANPLCSTTDTHHHAPGRAYQAMAHHTHQSGR
jgi:hypothetical protein